MVKSMFYTGLLGILLLGACKPTARDSEFMVNLAELRPDSGVGLAEMDQAIKSEPREPGLYRLRSQLHLQQKNFTEALADIEKAISLRSGQGEYHFIKARAHRALGQNQKALSSAMQAQSLNFNTSDLHVLLGDLHLALGHEQAALRSLNEAVRLHPENGFAYHYRGRALLMVGDTTRALDQWQRALREEPAFVPTYTEVARVFQLQKNFGQAERYVRMALVLEPLNGRLWYLRGLAYEGLSHPDSALLSYRQASTLDPNLEAQTTYRQARLAFQMQDYQKAIQFLLPLLEKDQNNAASRFMLAESYEKSGRLQEALGHYQVLKDNNPENRQAYVAYWRLNQYLRNLAARPSDGRMQFEALESRNTAGFK